MPQRHNPELPQAKPEIMGQFFASVPSECEAYIEETVWRDHLIYGTFTYDEDQGREYRTKEYDRSYYPEGTIRQLAAMAIPGNIKPEISAIRAPILLFMEVKIHFTLLKRGKTLQQRYMAQNY